LGGGQVGAPADDDHVPWSRPSLVWPSCRRCAGWSRCRLARAGAGPARTPQPERAGARLGPKGQQGGAGAEELEAAEGLTNFCQDHSGQVRVSNNTQTGGPDRRTGPRPGPRHGLRPSGRVRRGIEYRHKNVQIRVVGTPQVTFGAEVRPAPAPTRLGGHPTR
jgi:hypothetical protein